MLYIKRLLLGGDRLLNRQDVHTDTRATGGHHMRYLGKGQNGHTLEKARGLGVFMESVPTHVGVLSAADNKQRQNVLKLPLGVFPVKL